MLFGVPLTAEKLNPIMNVLEAPPPFENDVVVYPVGLQINPPASDVVAAVGLVLLQRLSVMAVDKTSVPQ